MAPRPRLPILVLERFIRRSVAHCLAHPPSIPTVDDYQPDVDDGARAPTAKPEQTSGARSVRDARPRAATATAARPSGAAVLLGRERQKRDADRLPLTRYAVASLRRSRRRHGDHCGLGCADLGRRPQSCRAGLQATNLAILRLHALQTPSRHLPRKRRSRVSSSQRCADTPEVDSHPYLTDRYGAHWRCQQFSWINEWEELTTRSGRCQGIEFVVAASFYQGVLDRLLVPLSRREKRRSGAPHRQEREP